GMTIQLKRGSKAEEGKSSGTGTKRVEEKDTATEPERRRSWSFARHGSTSSKSSTSSRSSAIFSSKTASSSESVGSAQTETPLVVPKRHYRPVVSTLRPTPRPTHTRNASLPNKSFSPSKSALSSPRTSISSRHPPASE